MKRLMAKAAALIMAIGMACPCPALSMTLEETARHAAANSPRIRAARTDIRAAEARLAEARSAGSPKISVSAVLARFNKPASTALPDISIPILPTPLSLPDVNLTENTYSAGFVSLTMPLYTGGRLTHAKNAAKAMISTADSACEATEAEIVYAAIRAYLAVGLARKGEEAAMQYRDTAEGHLRAAEKLLENRQVAKYEVIRAEAELEKACQKLKNAENQRRLAEEALRTAAALGRDSDFRVEEYVESEELRENARKSVEELYSIATGKSGRLKALKHKKETYLECVKKERAGMAPTVAGFAYQTIYSKRQPTSIPDSAAGILVNIPVFDGGKSRAGINAQESLAEKTELESQTARDELMLEIVRYKSDLENAEAGIASAEKRIELQTEILRLSERRFAECVGTGLEITDAATALTAARLSKAECEYQRLVSIFGMAKTSGILERAVGIDLGREYGRCDRQ